MAQGEAINQMQNTEQATVHMTMVSPNKSMALKNKRDFRSMKTKFNVWALLRSWAKTDFKDLLFIVLGILMIDGYILKIFIGYYFILKYTCG